MYFFPIFVCNLDFSYIAQHQYLTYPLTHQEIYCNNHVLHNITEGYRLNQQNIGLIF